MIEDHDEAPDAPLRGTTIPSVPDLVEVYARRIAGLRQRAVPSSAITFSVCLGQLLACELIERDLYDELMALPTLRSDL